MWLLISARFYAIPSWFYFKWLQTGRSSERGVKGSPLLWVLKKRQKKPSPRTRTETKLSAVPLKVFSQWHNSHVNSQFKIISCECLQPIRIHHLLHSEHKTYLVWVALFPMLLVGLLSKDFLNWFFFSLWNSFRKAYLTFSYEKC